MMIGDFHAYDDEINVGVLREFCRVSEGQWESIMRGAISEDERQQRREQFGAG